MMGRPEPRARSRSSLDLMESSRYSKKKAKPNPSTRPTGKATRALRTGSGLAGCSGGAATFRTSAPAVDRFDWRVTCPSWVWNVLIWPSSSLRLLA